MGGDKVRELRGLVGGGGRGLRRVWQVPLWVWLWMGVVTVGGAKGDWLVKGVGFELGVWP